MNCLINHIGLKGCGQDDAASGYYINDLLSDALQQTAKLTTSEKATFTGIWNDIQKRAVRRFGADVSNFLSKKYKLKSVTNSVNLGLNVNRDTNQTPPADEYRGIVIDLNPTGTCGRSALQVIHIQYLQVYLLQAAPIEIQLVDIDRLKSIVSYTINGVQGWNKIAEELDFDVTKLAIVYNAGPENSLPGITSPQFELPQACSSCATQLGCCQAGANCCEASITGITAVPDDNTFIYGTNSFGISGIFSVNCKYDGFVCANKNLFTYPLWQLLGYFMMDERVYSSRLNQFTLVNVDSAKERRDKFLEEYNRAMLDVLEGIDLCETGDCCLECNGQITMQEARM